MSQRSKDLEAPQMPRTENRYLPKSENPYLPTKKKRFSEDDFHNAAKTIQKFLKGYEIRSQKFQLLAKFNSLAHKKHKLQIKNLITLMRKSANQKFRSRIPPKVLALIHGWKIR